MMPHKNLTLNFKKYLALFFQLKGLTQAEIISEKNRASCLPWNN